MLVDYGNRWKASKAIYSKMLSSLLKEFRIVQNPSETAGVSLQSRAGAAKQGWT